METRRTALALIVQLGNDETENSGGYNNSVTQQLTTKAKNGSLYSDYT